MTHGADGAKIGLQHLLELTATLSATSRPLSAASQSALRGLSVSEREQGVRIDRVQTGTAAADAGLRSGDIVLQVDGAALAAGQRLSDLFGDKLPGSTVKLFVKRDDRELTLDVQLPADETDAALYGRDGRIPQRWQKELYRLAVVPIEFSDVEHNAKISVED